MTIREYLKSLGATDAELQAKVIGRMENAMLFDADLAQFKPDTVLKAIEIASNALSTANQVARQNINRAVEVSELLESASKKARNELDDLHQQIAGLKDAKISSPETKDAVMAYAATLNATKEIFGSESMTPDVIIAAISAGSYMAWRSIMGPKDNDITNFTTTNKRYR